MRKPDKKGKAPTKSRTFRLRLETLSRLERRAREERRSPNELVQQLLDASLPRTSTVDEVTAIAIAAGAERRGPLPRFDREALYDEP